MLSESEACLQRQSSLSSPGFDSSPQPPPQLCSLQPCLASDSAVGWTVLVNKDTASVSACLPAHPSACLPVYLPICLFACLPVHLLVYLPVPAHLSYLPIYLFASLPAHLSICLPTCPPVYLPVYLPSACLFTCPSAHLLPITISAHLSAHLPICPAVCRLPVSLCKHNK